MPRSPVKRKAARPKTAARSKSTADDGLGTSDAGSAEHLREMETRYRSIFEATTDGLGIANMEGYIVEANPAFCQMHGYSHDEVIGLHTTAIVHPDYHGLLAEGMQSIESGNRVQVTRTVNVRKDGTSFHIEGHGTPFLFNGKPHILGVARDITQRVQAEEELQKKEAEYRRIFESTSDGLIIGDLHGFVVTANPAACRMYGYALEDLIGLHLSQLVHPDYRGFGEGQAQTIEAGGKIQMQEVALRKDGTLFHTEVRGSQFEYDGKPHRLAAVRDISDREKAEEQLREREEQYRSIFEVSSDGFAITDLETGLVVDANPAMCRMHGYTYDEIIGLHPTEFVHPDYHEAFRQHSETVKAGGSYRARSVDVRKDGTPFHVEVYGTTFTHKGKPRRLAVLRDITEQVRAYELLEERVEERTRELSTLLDVSHNVSSTLELQPLLGLILDQLKAVVDFNGATIMEVQGEDLVTLYRIGPGRSEGVVQRRFRMTTHELLWQSMHRGESIIIGDVRSDTPLAEEYRRVNGELMDTTLRYVHSWMGVPMMLKERAVGLLALASVQRDYYTPHHADLALAIAQQAAIGIENARLHQRAQEMAALEERQRLSRELHDSVSQALYGIGLGAQTARTLVERDPAQAIQPLDYVVSLAQTGMAEMRALIFELRPEALEAEGLVAALDKQAAALQARHNIVVRTTLACEPDVPGAIKEALYRIGQEAMHNTVKHAQAREVQVVLDCSDEEIVLEVRDDGKGFDSSASYPGHVGLHSMEERAIQLGGTLEVESAVGAGTRIRARIPCQREA